MCLIVQHAYRHYQSDDVITIPTSMLFFNTVLSTEWNRIQFTSLLSWNIWIATSSQSATFRSTLVDTRLNKEQNSLATSFSTA